MPETGDGIVLVGMPGTGKSTVGRLLAESLGRPFIDTDALFERLHGAPVPDYLRQHGEPSFRAAEAAVVAQACATPGAVIAAGGGAVLDPLGRWALWHHGTVAWLDLPAEHIVQRLSDDDVPRPGFEPYEPGRIASVVEQRAPMYRGADLRLDADRPAAALAAEIAAARQPAPGRTLFDADVPRNHPIGPRTARVVMGVDLDPSSVAERGLAVVDDRVAPPEHARAMLQVRAGERAKRLSRLATILEWLADQAAERDEPLLAVGGGTIGDLAGTAAALYARGLPLVQVPTTWLAQADSAIGGKVAVDLRAAKNAVGAFWPPVAVVADTARLRTLPRRLRRDGIAESVKCGLIGDPLLWRLLEERGAAALAGDEPARYAIIERSARLKLDVCARDPFEAGERRTLNLGHTIGHALEIESGYRLRHGAAVALGMRAVAAIAARRGADADLPSRLDVLLRTLGFDLTRAFDPAAARAALRTDKKRHRGRQRWILPMAIGQVQEVDDVTDDELTAALEAIAA